MKHEAPPPTHVVKNKVDWGEIIARLKAAPGEWYNVGDFSPAMAYHLRKGVNKAFLDPADTAPAEVQMNLHWEFTSRKGPSGQSALYIRYLG
jgi:hypothetical protein